MDRASVYRLMAIKWLETAERVENRSLKRCYMRRALRYQAMAAVHDPKREQDGRGALARSPPQGHA